MTRDYVVWAHSRKVKHSCVLDELSGVEKIFELREGVSRADSFPESARYSMSADFPNHTVLTDSLINTDSIIVASRRLRGVFETRNVTHIEFLPVAVIDHKDKPVEKEYYILNPIHPVDCLDLEKSQVTWDEIVEQDIRTVRRIVLDPARVDPNREIFRLNRYFTPILVRRDLADAIDRDKLTGTRWIELDNYPEI